MSNPHLEKPYVPLQEVIFLCPEKIQLSGHLYTQLQCSIFLKKLNLENIIYASTEYSKCSMYVKKIIFIVRVKMAE